MNGAGEAEMLVGSPALPRAAKLARVAARFVTWIERRDVRAALIGTLGLRIATSAFAALVAVLLNGTYLHVSLYANNYGESKLGIYVVRSVLSGPAEYLTSPWMRWDANHYIGIAASGYAPNHKNVSAFLPFYPTLIRLGGYLTGGNLVVSALIISTIASFFAFLLLYQLILRVTSSPQIAGYSVVIACLLPIAFFLMAPYTESLFLALSLACMLDVLDERWGRAALFATAASLTRQQGLALGVLALPALFACLRQFLRAGDAGLRPRLARLWRTARGPATLAGAALLAYVAWLVVLQIVLGQQTPLELLTSPHGWNQHFEVPGLAILANLHTFVIDPTGSLFHYLSLPLDTAAAIAALIGLIVTWRTFPRAIWLYLFTCWCVALAKVDMFGNTTSAARYLLALFPLCMVPAGWFARARPDLRVAFVGLFAYLWCFYFGEWVLWSWVS
jgi:Mannosyltransferase (PIG-V)